MTDVTQQLADALRECAIVFRQYEQMHLAKKTQDGDEKAYRNHQMADVCEKTLTAFEASRAAPAEDVVERVAQAILAKIVERKREIAGRASLEADEFDVMCAHEDARAALAAMPRDEGLEALREKPGMMLSLTLNAPRGIYTASKTYHAPLWQQYRSEGYPIISTWIDEAGPGETQDHHDLWTRCIHESQMCEAMVVYREADDILKGAWLEMGVALGAGVPVFAVGCEDFTIGKSGLLIHCATVDEAMRRARNKLAQEPRK